MGSRSAQVGIYDLKQRKIQMVNAHNHPVTVLCFSEDGKFLATYYYGDSMLRYWLVRIKTIPYNYMYIEWIDKFSRWKIIKYYYCLLLLIKSAAEFPKLVFRYRIDLWKTM